MPTKHQPRRHPHSDAKVLSAVVLGVLAGLGLAFFAPGAKAPDPDAPPPVDVPDDVVAGAVYGSETFDTGSLIIPMDECHQYSGQTANPATRTSPLCYCPDTTADTGQIRAYGLIYRLFENGIPVRILINDAKTAIDGVDATITSPTTTADPVKRFTAATNTETAFYTSSCASGSGTKRSIGYRGAPFVIPAAYAAQARLLIKNGSAGIGSPVRGAFAATDFNMVDVHVAQTAFTAKVARRYAGTPKPLALLDIGGASIDVLLGYLNLAGLNTTGSSGTACAPGKIYGRFSSVSDFTTSNCLTVGGYTTLWAPHWEPDTTLSSTKDVIDKIGAFVDSGRALFAECASIEVFEGSFNEGSLSAGTLALSAASYSSSTKKLTMSGTGIAGDTVTFGNANNCSVTLGTAVVSAGGTWSWTSAAFPSNSSVPCRVSVDGGGNFKERNVSSAPSGCSPSGSGGICSSKTAKKCTSIDTSAVSTGHYQTTNGIVKNVWGLSSTAYGNGVTGDSSTEGFMFRDVTNVMNQKGDTRFVAPIGLVANWRVAQPPTCSPTVTMPGGTAGASNYKANTTQFISTCANADYNATSQTCNQASTAPVTSYSDEDSAWDVFSYRRKDDDANKGPIIYMGGHNYGTGSSGANNVAGIRLVLNTLLNLESQVYVPDPKEVVRSAPIVADVVAANGTVKNTYLQGTFMINDPPETPTTFSDAAHADEFRFPATTGHVIAIDTANVPTGSTEFADLDPGQFLWDAADKLPPAPTGTTCTTKFNGSCRTVFTTVSTGLRPARVSFDKGSRATFESLLGGVTGANADSLVTNILAGRAVTVGGTKVPTLGGVDWSSMAVIESSTKIGTNRPTMVYVGGLDGMLHAFCANTVAPCDVVGRELWAYIPRTQLGALRYNQQTIDGAPKVADMYGDFDGNGTRELRTILAFQTGHGDPASTDNPPAVIAMDITAPNDPKVIWEVATPAVRGTFAQGEGLGLAMGPVKVGASTKGVVFIATNNGGTGTSGMFVQALDIETGAKLWANPWTRTYPAGRSGGASPPNSGIPGGLAGVDMTSSGTITHLVVPTLYGELYVLDATTGLNIYSDALFRFTGDFQAIGSAPTIYQDASGALIAVVVSGAYVDPDGATWLTPSGTHYAVAVKLQQTGSTVYNETGANSANRPFSISFTGEVGFSSATVAGGELFFVTADHDVNNLSVDNGAGHLHRVNLLTGTQTSSTNLASSGAAAVEATTSGKVYAAGLEDILKVAPTGFNGTGNTVEITPNSVSTRRLWLRTE